MDKEHQRSSTDEQRLEPPPSKQHLTPALPHPPMQVLKVVLECVPDAATLLACSMLSTTCQCMVQQALQGRSARLAELVTGSSSTCAIQWLCGLAGPAAVNSYPAGCALLDKVMQMPQDVAPLMLATGAPWTHSTYILPDHNGDSWLAWPVRNRPASARTAVGV
jgi:hypothetical protein